MSATTVAHPEALTRGGPTQRRLRRALGQVGGYWRPLAGLARVLEELGEIAELLSREAPATPALASELADLWIITTALADQFLAEVAEPAALAPSANHERGAGADPFAELCASAGRIARIVNYYDGPKTPRSLQGWCSIEEETERLHARLAALAAAHGADLARAVHAKLEAIPARDGGRFARSYDPSTAAVLDELRGADVEAPELDLARAGLWGATDWSSRSLERNVEEVVPSLVSFTRAAPFERMDAYVVGVGDLASTEPSGGWLQRLLDELAKHDPRSVGVAAADTRGDVQARSQVFVDGVLAPLSFNGLILSARALAAPRRGAPGPDRAHDAFVVLALAGESRLRPPRLAARVPSDRPARTG